MTPVAQPHVGESPGTENPVRAEGEERRDRRSRDRYGRDRRERTGDRNGDRSEGARDASAVTTDESGTPPEQEPVTRSYFERPSSVPTAPAEAQSPAAPVAPVAAITTALEPVAASVEPAVLVVPTAPAVQPTPAAAAQVTAVAALPPVAAFKLPIEELAQVAESSGLQWVNSDAGKIAAVQAAIAAEPQRVHVPRERPPVPVTEEGPLVLVETKKDLRNLSLPF
jgi:ribonuclease E